AGIATSYVLISELPDPKAKDFGLWDDELLGEVEYLTLPGEAPRLHRCRYYSASFHLERARAWQRSISRHSRPCPDLPSEATLLHESAFALPRDCLSHCKSSTLGKSDCSAYHLSWQTLRLYGL